MPSNALEHAVLRERHVRHRPLVVAIRLELFRFRRRRRQRRRRSGVDD